MSLYDTASPKIDHRNLQNGWNTAKNLKNGRNQGIRPKNSKKMAVIEEYGQKT